MAEIKFLRGSRSNWNGIGPKNESHFYLVNNEDSSIDLYLGEKLLAKGTSYAELTAEISRSIAEDERLAELISSLTTNVEGDISSAVANLQSLIQAEQTRAEGQEAAIRTEFTNADSALSERIKAIEDDYLVEADKTELSNAIASEKSRAEEQEAAIRDEFAAADTALKASILGGVSEEYDTLAELAAKIGEVEGAAKSYSLVAVTSGLGENVKEAFKLVDEDGLQVGETIKVYKDSSLISVELKEDQKLYYTYVLANGEQTTVDVDMSKFLAESEFKDGLQVIGGEVSVKVAEGSEAFLSVDANGVKLSGIQDAIDAAESDAIDAAKEYADGLDSALSERIQALEDDKSFIKAVNVNGVEATIADNKATVTIEGDDIKLSSEYESVEYQEISGVTFNGVSASDNVDAAIKKVEGNFVTLVDEILKNEKVVAHSIKEIKRSVGLDKNLKYVKDTSANYISNASTFSEADSLLDAAIKANADAISSNESDLLNAVNEEKVRAEAAEQALQSALDAEKVRAEAAEQALQGALDAEIARAKALKGSGNIEVSIDTEGIQTIGMVWCEF